MSDAKSSTTALPGLGAPLSGRAAMPAKQREFIEKLQALLERGIALQREGKTDDAKAIFKGILQTNPNQPDALNLLGVILASEGNMQEGIELLYRAVTLRPRDPVILNNVGHTFSKMYQFQKAIEFLQRAVAIHPRFIEALNNLAAAYRMAGRHEDAILCDETIIAEYPDRPSGYVGLARILHDMGKIKEAETYVRRAIDMAPDNPMSYGALAQTQKFKDEPPELKKMIEIAEPAKDESGGPLRRNLLFAIGKIYDDLGRYDEAFGYFKRANDAETAEFDLKKFESDVDELISVYSKEFFAQRKDYGCQSDRPIFIVGMPRSGTTLLEQILSSHPQVHGAGELEYVAQLTHRSPEFCELHPAVKSVYPSNMVSLTKLGAEILARSYLWDVKRHSTEAARVTDKMPHNFLNVGFIALLFPKAKIIRSKRNAVDNCLSIYTQAFNEYHAYKKDLAALGRYYRTYDRIMRHWRETLPGRVLEVDYEDVVADQEGKSRELIDYLGLPWAPECLDFYKASRTVLTASRWQVRQPIYKRSVERWRHYGDNLKPLIDALGDCAGV